MSGWTNVTATVPWVVVDPATGKTVYRIDSNGTTLTNPVSDWTVRAVTSRPGSDFPALVFADPVKGDFAELSTVGAGGIQLLAYPAGQPSHAAELILRSDGTIALAQPGNAPGLYFSSTAIEFGATASDPNPVQYNLAKNIIEVANMGWQQVTLLNGWVQRPSWETLQYRMLPTGHGELKGAIQGGTTALNTSVGIVPPAFRPAVFQMGPIVSSDLTGAGAGSPRAEILPDGNIWINGTGAGPLSFAGYTWPLT